MSPDFRDILSAFLDEGVEFLLVGAQALSAHGLVRSTGDMDLRVHPTPENAARVHAALLRFGAPANLVAVADFDHPDSVVQLGVPPLRIDVITSITGVGFEEAWPARIVVRLDELEVPVLSRRHLIANKRATGRPRDLEDLRWLEKDSAG